MQLQQGSPDSSPLYAAALLSCWGSRLRLFGDEAGDIGTEAIAMPFLQQDRVNRSAEKAAAHDRKGNPAERCVDHVLAKGVEPRLV